MTTETINIRIREDGARAVSKNIKQVGSDAAEAAEDVDVLTKALGLLAGAFALDKLQQWSDAWGTAAGLIRTSTKSVEEAIAVQDALYKSAQKTRSEYSSVVELYSRAARAGADLGASQADLIKFSEGVGKALAIQGTSAEQASGALLQLGQALGNGRIQAEEYNSLLDNGQVILQTVAENLEGAGGSVGKLTRLVKDGNVSSKEFFDAFLAGSDALDAKFQQTSVLWSQGWQVIENAVIKFVGELNEAYGLSNKFGEFAQWFSSNVPQMAAAITALGVALAVAFAPEKIAAFYGQMQKLFALMAAHPFIALASAIAGVLTYLYLMRDEIKLGIDDTTTLGDLMRSVWEDVGPAIEAAADIATQFFAWLTDSSAGTFEQLINDLVGYEHESESMWLKILRVVIQVFDMIGGTIRGVIMGITAFIKSQVDLWVGVFTNMAKQVEQVFAGDFAGALQTGQDTLGLFTKNAETMAGTFTDAFRQEILSQSDSGLEAWLDDRLKRAQEIAKDRLKDAGGATADLTGRMGGNNPATSVDKGAAKKAERELEQLKRQLRQIQDAADPVAAAMRDLSDAEDVLAKATAKGLITAAEKVTLYDKLKASMRQALDPFQYMLEELEHENELLKLSSEQYNIKSEMYRRQQELERSGVTLTAEQNKQLEEQIALQEQLNRLAQVRDQLESESQARKQRDLSEKVSTATGMIGQDGYTAGDALSSLGNEIPGLDVTQEFLAAQQEQYAMYYAAIDELRQQDLISETSAVQAKIAIFQQQYAQQFQAASNALGALSSLQKSENKKQAAIGKAAAIAQAIINTYSSATASYNAMAGIPYVGPFLGAAAAAAAIAAGMANVQAIRAQNVGNFRTGGEFMVGGSGGTDSQQVSFRATPGERVQINTPAQARALERADEARNSDATPVVNQTINQNFSSKPDRTTQRQQQRDMRRSAIKNYEGV